MDDIKNDDQAGPDELTLLKERATTMGITFHPNIGVAALKEKLNEKLKPPTASPAEQKAEMHAKLRRDANALVRCRISNMNPAKKNHPGEVFSVSNKVIGTIKKYIPYQSEEPYHVPRCLFDNIKERMYQLFVEYKLSNGQKGKRSRLVKEFAIEELPPLTEEELKDLAVKQALNHSIDA